jgi:transaldolase / glucose-6-phosphate isomerase
MTLENDLVQRIWAHDATVWSGADEARWLGWLNAGLGQSVDLAELKAFQDWVRTRGFRHILLMGMGGSSLAPEVIAAILGAAPGFPALTALDSTHPDQIRRVEASLDLSRTLFIVASKSGSTLEPDVLHRYFWARAGEVVDRPGDQFVAITDPGSKLEALAGADGFARVFLGDPSIGGRFSALSPFGMVPAAALGLDVEAALAGAAVMARACQEEGEANPGLTLGLALGRAAAAGCNKLTIIASPGLAPLGAWLEQLIAESTGKQGVGILPFDGEAVGVPGVYGEDRIFAYLRLDGETGLDAPATALAEAGFTVLRLDIKRREDLFAEFFRWEFATAVAGAVLGINPFDQPDVEASKIKTRALTDAYEAGEALPDRAIGRPEDIDATVRGADYIALLAYLDRTEVNVRALGDLQTRLRDRYRIPVAVGFGPRYLHSTGQAYKGGPAGGAFVQFNGGVLTPLPIPGRSLDFAQVVEAQACGDLSVLEERGRRTLALDLGLDIQSGLRNILISTP